MSALMKNHFSPYIYKFNTVGQIPYFSISLPFYIGGKRERGREKRDGGREREVGEEGKERKEEREEERGRDREMELEGERGREEEIHRESEKWRERGSDKGEIERVCVCLG